MDDGNHSKLSNLFANLKNKARLVTSGTKSNKNESNRNGNRLDAYERANNGLVRSIDDEDNGEFVAIIT